MCLKSNGIGATNNSFNSKQPTTWFFIQINPLEYDVLFHHSLSCFYALLEGFFWDDAVLCLYGPRDGLHAFKMSHLDDPLELGEKKSYTKQDQIKR